MLIADPSFGAVCQLSFSSLILMGLLGSVIFPPREKPAPSRARRFGRWLRSGPLIGEDRGQPAAFLGLGVEPAAQIANRFFPLGRDSLPLFQFTGSQGLG